MKHTPHRAPNGAFAKHPGIAYLRALIGRTGLNPSARRLADPLYGHTPANDPPLPAPERIQRPDPEPAEPR